jgi:hypothetical protein
MSIFIIIYSTVNIKKDQNKLYFGTEGISNICLGGKKVTEVNDSEL